MIDTPSPGPQKNDGKATELYKPATASQQKDTHQQIRDYNKFPDDRK